MKTTLIFILFNIAVSLTCRAQIDAGLGTWNILHFDAKMNDSWSGFFEAQLRSLNFYHDYHYYEYKGALTYEIQKNSTLSLGFGQYRTYNEGGNFVRPMLSDELRLWPQFILTQKIKRLKIEHRYRAEFRFTNNGFRNRFRLRFGISHPVLENKIKHGILKFRANNELFFTNRAPYFERNRSQLQFAYEPNARTEILMGYLHQFDYQINDEIGRDFLVVGFTYRFDWSKPQH